jgi:hypothetical protein
MPWNTSFLPERLEVARSHRALRAAQFTDPFPAIGAPPIVPERFILRHA